MAAISNLAKQNESISANEISTIKNESECSMTMKQNARGTQEDGQPSSDVIAQASTQSVESCET